MFLDLMLLGSDDISDDDDRVHTVVVGVRDDVVAENEYLDANANDVNATNDVIGVADCKGDDPATTDAVTAEDSAAVVDGGGDTGGSAVVDAAVDADSGVPVCGCN